MSNGAPVCPVSRPQAVPGQGARPYAPVPHAHDAATLVQAVNTINNILMIIAGPGPVTNNFYPPPNMQPIPPSQNNTFDIHGGGGVSVRQDWMERGRDDDRGEVWHTKEDGSEDKNMKVCVERIYHLDFSPAGASMEAGMIWEWKEFDRKGKLHRPGE